MPSDRHEQKNRDRIIVKNSILLRGRTGFDAPLTDILARNGRIEQIRPAGRASADLGDERSFFLPPLFDIQVNGAAGQDLQDPGLDRETLARLNDYLNARGVMRWMPTLVTDDLDAMEHRCHVIATAMEDRELGRHIPGIHLEGPFISEEDGPRGAHPRAHVRPPSLKAFRRLYRAGAGRIRYMTLAPERPGALRLIRELAGLGIVPALGHHAAQSSDIRAAADAGARLCTHLGNGLAPYIHRHHSGLWGQLADDRLHISLIADKEHLPPEVIKVYLGAKGIERTILVSDSVWLAGMPPGRYTLFGAGVHLKPTGRVCLEETDLLAGSSLMLPLGIFNAAWCAGISLKQAAASASFRPARLFGLPWPAWPPKAGRAANLVLMSITEDSKGSVKAMASAVFDQGRTVTLKTG